jgi:hypothetical protein
MIGRSLTMAAALFAGFLASQAPEFAQQYRQRLGGAVDELARVVDGFDRDAATAGLDRQKALGVMNSANQELVRLRGASMQEAIERYDRLSRQLRDFEASGSLGKIASVVETPDTPLVQSTFASFVPAVPTTPAGLVTAAGAFFLIYLLLGVIRLIARPMFRRRQREARRREAGYDTRSVSRR